MKKIISASLLLATSLFAQVSVEQYRDGGDTKFLRPVVKITNTSGQSIAAQDLSFSYYIYEQNLKCADFQFEKWYSSVFSTKNTQINCTDLNTTDKTGNRKSNIELNIEFTGSEYLLNYESQELKFGIRTNNWDVFNEADDWSFINTSSPLASTHVAVFVDGIQVSGIAPISDSAPRHSFVPKQWMAELSTSELVSYTFEEGDFYTNTDDGNTYQFTGGKWELFFGTQVNSSTFVDLRDNQSYKKITIGNQVWMAENLNYNFPNSKCYNGDPLYCEYYGRFYSVDNYLNGSSYSDLIPSGVQGVCPSGWHIPSNGEWQVFLDYVRASSSTPDNIRDDIKSSYDWPVGFKGNDKFGFNALPAGYADGGVSTAEYSQTAWLSASSSIFGLSVVTIPSGDYDIDIRGVGLGYYVSVRCIVD